MNDELDKNIDEVSPGSFLARLWRIILFNDGYIRFIVPRTNDYISKMCIRSELTNSRISINKTNVQNKIISTDMTWKNFIFLLKEIIVVSNIEVTFRIKRNNVTTSYTEKGLLPDILSKIWIQIKKDYTNELPSLVNKYLERVKDKSNAVSETNLSKKMDTKAVMSWKTLVFLIDEILYSESIVLEVKVEHRGKSYSTHRLEYYIGNKGETNE